MRIYVTVKITQKEHLLIWNSDITQNLKIYLYDCRIERAIFLAAKHEKTIMGGSYLVFYKYFLHFENLASNTIKDESINLNSWHHSHKKQKNSLETQVVLLIFLLELEIHGVTVQKIHQIKTAKNGSFCEELPSENELEAALASFCCYDYGANTSGALQKISTRTLELFADLLKQLIL